MSQSVRVRRVRRRRTAKGEGEGLRERRVGDGEVELGVKLVVDSDHVVPRDIDWRRTEYQ